jgi:hypothetical protein
MQPAIRIRGPPVLYLWWRSSQGIGFSHGFYSWAPCRAPMVPACVRPIAPPGRDGCSAPLAATRGIASRFSLLTLDQFH